MNLCESSSTGLKQQDSVFFYQMYTTLRHRILLLEGFLIFSSKRAPLLLEIRQSKVLWYSLQSTRGSTAHNAAVRALISEEKEVTRYLFAVGHLPIMWIKKKEPIDRWIYGQNTVDVQMTDKVRADRIGRISEVGYVSQGDYLKTGETPQRTGFWLKIGAGRSCNISGRLSKGKCQLWFTSADGFCCLGRRASGAVACRPAVIAFLSLFRHVAGADWWRRSRWPHFGCRIDLTCTGGTAVNRYTCWSVHI